MSITSLGFFWTEASQSRNEITRRYEPIQPFFLHALSESLNVKYFFDVGSNIGYYTAFISLLPTISHIYAFEASAETFSHLSANIELNNLQGRVDFAQKAVSDTCGTVQFQIESSLSGINSIVETSLHNQSLYKETVEVECCSLDSIQDYSGEVVALKIDVEGHEANVLAGAKALLRNNICIVQVEIYGDREYEIMEFLRSFGYEKICQLSSDVYFSNAPLLHNKAVVFEILQRSIDNQIKDNLGTWKKKDKAQIVNIAAEISGTKMSAFLSYDQNVFSSDPEFAFYVLQNRTRVMTQWYSDQTSVEYTFDDSASPESLVIRGFVREKHNHEKKLPSR